MLQCSTRLSYGPRYKIKEKVSFKVYYDKISNAFITAPDMTPAVPEE